MKNKLQPRKYFMGGAASPDGMYVSFPNDKI